MVWFAVLAATLSLAEGKEPGGSVDLKPAIEAIRKAGPDGRGAAEAARAWQQLAKADVGRLTDLLAGMDGATPLARNWLRSAVDQIVQEARAAKKPLPTAALEAHLLDLRHQPQARRLAYELLVEADKSAPEKYLPKMLDDPSPELRRDAVARLLAKAEGDLKGEKKQDALPRFRECLKAARDKDQIDRAVRQLRELGDTVDLPKHLGLVLDWKMVGPFPNAKQEGVDTPYLPEKKLDFAAEYEAKGAKIRWKDYVTTSENGIADVYAALGQHVASVFYAATEFTSKDARDVEIRLGSFSAFKLWVNGELVLVRGDAYTGMRLDHYVAQAKLKPGKNTILLKLSLEEPPPQLPKMCRFMLRVCDENGVAVLSTSRPAAPVTEKKS